MAGLTVPAGDLDKMVTALTELVTSGAIPVTQFAQVYNQQRSTQAPRFAVLDVESGGEIEAVQPALRRAIQDGFFIALSGALLGQLKPPRADGDSRAAAIAAAMRSTGGVGTMQRMLRLAGARQVSTLLPIMRAAQATAVIRYKPPGTAATAFGTGFLVGPSLMLTAAHVVEPLIENQKPRPGSGALVSVEFHNQLEALGKWPIKTEFAEDWLVAMSPPNGKNGQIALDDTTGAATQLDFVLVRLAAPVGSVAGVVDVAEPPDPQVPSRLAVIGYDGGTECLFDDHLLNVHDAAISRIRHDVNTEAGMSGGPCLDSDGRAVALHEGAITNVVPEYNRGVHLAAVRRVMRQAGADPLSSDTGPLHGLHDREALLAWIAAGEALLGTTDGARKTWLDSVATFNPDATAAGGSADLFHPVFGRRDFQDWIAQASLEKAAGRILLVSGPSGSGKSFSAAILRQRLKGTPHVMVLVPPVVARRPVADAVGFMLTQAGGLSLVGEGAALRPAAGILRRDVLPSAFTQLLAAVRTPARPAAILWLVIDIGEDAALTADVAAEWKQFLIEAESRPEVRLIVLGLSTARRGEFRAAAAAADKVESKGLTGVTSDEFVAAIRGQAEALRLPPDEWEAFGAGMWDNVLSSMSLAQGLSVHAVRVALEIRMQMLKRASEAGGTP